MQIGLEMHILVINAECLAKDAVALPILVIDVECLEDDAVAINLLDVLFVNI